ncbi:hypothetical protein GJAV_G00274200 [Gymnothorax javanicus]|nr:hypothetical protein GJAV_G00274200 [Gymnothorax javanicus]
MSVVIGPWEDLHLDIPQSLQDFASAAEMTALLFHISYHSLAKFPDLERIIRANAVEAQKAFNFSEVLLWQCISASDNMVTILFPVLITSVQRREAPLAVKYLGKAEGWIEVVIRDIDQMVVEYGKLIQNVARATSDVNTVKVQTDQKTEKLNRERNALEGKVAGLQREEKAKQFELAENEMEREAASKDLQKHGDDIAGRGFDIGVAILRRLSFFRGQRAINSSEDSGRLRMARDEIRGLQDKRANLSRELGKIQTELMHCQSQLSKSLIELVPDPVHLPEVQQNLIRVQEILLQLKSFWEKIEVLIGYLQQKNFVGEEMIDLTEERKDELLLTIEKAKKAWIQFKEECMKSVIIFAVQNNNAYKFLETSPSSLTDEEWEEQYNDLKTRLENPYETPTPREPPAPAGEGSSELAAPAREGSSELAAPAGEGSTELAAPAGEGSSELAAPAGESWS